MALNPCPHPADELKVEEVYDGYRCGACGAVIGPYEALERLQAAEAACAKVRRVMAYRETLGASAKFAEFVIEELTPRKSI